MRLAGLVILGLIAATPACAQYHGDIAAREQMHLDEVEAQRADNAAIARATKPRPPTEADKKAAAWRADHLTCASKKGRTAAQYAAECKPTATP